MNLLNLIGIITYFLVSYSSADELIAVTVLVRHGGRLPENLYPNDPYQNYSWPYILGDLTNEGVKQMYHVGEWLRMRYIPDFISKKYDPAEIFAQSVDYDRCLMSGGATLAGLFPPTSTETWNKHIRWQPIPIHVSPIWQDFLVDVSVCPKIPEESVLIRRTRKYAQVMAKYQHFFDFISQNSGLSVDFSTIYPIFDILFSELKMNLELPTWAKEIYPTLVPLVIEYTKMDSMTKTERRIQVGPLLGRIINQFDNAINGENFGTTKTIYRKFMTYYGTEWILYDLTYTLGLPGIDIPEFGAIYSIELRKSSNGTYYVNIWYRHSTDLLAKTVPAPIKGMNFNLDYTEFKNYVKPYIVNNASEWVSICENFTGQQVQVDTNVVIS
ncbi:hypothetical protein HHI36_009273 [Cryptolaemus montrouzieri]|uniref:Acid phosphatase n=1 Tax=Cryptolaemus montrouzieri TaxID=559131 RepID=A0ABD2MVN5_9CUCU